MNAARPSISSHLADALRLEIQEGRFGPGDRIDAERELARRWGVARLTVARALDELVKEGLLERQQGRGTFVKTVDGARPRRGARSSLARIGLCFLDLYETTHPYFARITKSLTDCCARKGRELSVFAIKAGDLYHRRDNPLVSALAQRLVGGLVIAGRMIVEDMVALKQSGVPFVWINREVPGEDTPAVFVDYARGAFEAVRFLAGMGHRRVGLILGTRRNPASRLSLTGYSLAHEASGLAADPGLIAFGKFDSESGYRQALRLLEGDDPPTAILAADDIIAGGVLRAAYERGLAVPGDLSIVGCGNFFEAHDTPVALTTIDTHLEKAARSAADLLERLAAGHAGVADDVLIRPDLVIRASTGPVGGAVS